nr:OST-HTH/LOTUS domain-containing protein [Nesterenkonia sp. DZ6]
MRNAVEAARGDDGWANLGAVGQQISNQASLDPRNYGYRKLSDLIEATELFQVKRQNLGVFVRDRGLAVSGAPRRG